MGMPALNRRGHLYFENMRASCARSNYFTMNVTGATVVEAEKLKSEMHKNYAEARKGDIESLAKLREMEGRTAHTYQAPPASFVPRSVVLTEAKHWGLNEGYANHILNRTLPTYVAVKQYCENIEVNAPTQNPYTQQHIIPPIPRLEAQRLKKRP